MCGKRMTKSVITHPFGDVGSVYSFFYSPLNNSLMYMVTPFLADFSILLAILLGNTHCQDKSAGALGYFRSRAYGTLSDIGNIVTRSLASLPSRTVISQRVKSISLTPNLSTPLTGYQHHTWARSGVSLSALKGLDIQYHDLSAMRSFSALGSCYQFVLAKST